MSGKALHIVHLYDVVSGQTLHNVVVSGKALHIVHLYDVVSGKALHIVQCTVL